MNCNYQGNIKNEVNSNSELVKEEAATTDW